MPGTVLTPFRESLLEKGANTKGKKIQEMGKVRIPLMSFKHRESAMLNTSKYSFLFQRIEVVFLLLATEKDLPVTGDQSEVGR